MVTLLLALALAPASAQTIVYSAPIVITQGGTYTGNYRSLSSSVPCVLINTNAPVVLEGCLLTGAGNLIQSGDGANVTVRNCTGQGLTPTVSNQSPGRFLDAYRAQSLTIEHNAFTQTSGIVVNRWSGTGLPGQTLTVRYNKVRNIDGRWINGGSTRSSFVILNTVQHLAGVEVAYNEVFNAPDQSLVEDNINLYNSSGTAASAIRVHDNFVRGAYPYPATATGFTGTGMTTDGDDSTLSGSAGFIEADHNQFVGTGNAAMNLAAGHDIYYHDNRAVTSGTLPDGRTFSAGWAGFGVFNYYNQPASVYFNNRVENNTVGYVRWGANSPYANRQDLSPGSCGPCTGTISLPNPITTATEDAEVTLWQTKVQQAGVVIGPLNGATSTTPTTSTPTTTIPATTTGTVINPGFELDGAAVGSPIGWATLAGANTSDNADYTETYGGGHSGTYHATHYRPDPYEVYTYQTVTNLPNGTYKLSAWFKSTGGQPVAQLKAQNFGGTTLTAAVPTSPSTWVQVSVSNILVTNGQCQIGVYSNASAGQWLHFDDLELVAQTMVANTPPTVSLAASATLTLGQPLILTATAADANGRVSKVEFFNGTTSLGSTTTAPYQFSWTPTVIGVYSLTAVATDNSGASTTSAAVPVVVALPIVVVNRTIVNPGFEADNAAVSSPTGWSTTGDANADYTEAYGGAHSGTYHGSHWRTSSYEVYTYQTLSGLTNGTYKFSAWIKSDGGQPTAQLQAKNYGGALLTANITNTYGSWVQVSISGIQVTNGQCELGFYSKAYASQWFYFDDVTFTAQAPNTPPTVSLAASATLTLGQPLALNATAADADGSVSKVEFFNGTTSLGSATAAPYQLNWTPIATGTYTLTAVATDNSNASTTSTVVTVLVTTPVVVANSTLVNPGFEVDNAAVSSPTGWSTTGDANADYTEAYGGAHSGTYHGSHWRTSNYEVYTYQTLSGLTNGTYKFSAWIKSDGGQPTAQLQAKNYGGALLTTNVTSTYGNWVKVEVSNIQVTNGQCEIGFYSKAYAYQSFYFDDVTFGLQPVGVVLNNSFEEDYAPVLAPRAWSTQTYGTTQAYASFTETYGGAHTGTYHGTHYRPENYEIYTYQVVTNVPNGTYKLNAWMKSTGGQTIAQLKAQNFGGTTLTAAVPTSPDTWVQVTILGIQVTNGKCEVGIYSKANGGQGLHFDDVELLPQSATGARTAQTTTIITAEADAVATSAEVLKPALYPNPANEQVAISATFDHAASVTLVVTDLQGLPIAKYQRFSTVGENQFSLSTADLPTGLYLLRVEGNTALPTQRLEVKH